MLSVRLRVISVVACLAIGSLGSRAMCSGTATADPVRQVSFSGSLVQPNRDGSDSDGEVLRQFDVQLFQNSGTAFFVVSDDTRHGCPWPDSFGRAGGGRADEVQPHLVYSHDTTTYVLPLPPLVVKLPEQAAVDVEWEQDGWLLRMISSETVAGQPAWLLEAAERRGRRQSLTVDAATGITLKAEADVFMGQGEEFQLVLARTSEQSLNESVSAQLEELAAELLSLQAAMKRRPDGFQRELTARQIADVDAQLDKLTRLAAETPLKSFVAEIGSDVAQQHKRLAFAEDQAGKLKGTAAPDYELALARGGSLSSASLKNKTVVLHFWDYRDSPLSEPYGQTGYLEFLFNQKKADNVQVIGISTNPELQTAEHRARGMRGIRKLAEFMNLSYPIGVDDGTLLQTLGDPRNAKGQLPLWIVIAPDGTIAHYHAGLFEVDAALGLKQLELVLNDIGAGRKP